MEKSDAPTETSILPQPATTTSEEEGTFSARSRGYRREVYARYASVHVRQWLTADDRSQVVWARAAMHRLRGWLPEDRTIRCLDLGCGAGHLLAALRDAGYRNVRGVDISQEAVAAARSKRLEVSHEDLRGEYGIRGILCFASPPEAKQ